MRQLDMRELAFWQRQAQKLRAIRQIELAEATRIGQAAKGEDYSSGITAFRDIIEMCETGINPAIEREKQNIAETWDSLKMKQKLRDKGRG